MSFPAYAFGIIQRYPVMRTTLTAFLLVLGLAALAQAELSKHDRPGTISVGGRSSMSFFNDGGSGRGTGVGGQFRIRLAPRVNTDWFYDYFTSPIGDLAHRQDQHIGWSVMFYLREPGETRQFFQPYVLAGHCFDHTRQQANTDRNVRVKRWSSAVQVGAGTHFNLTERTDLSLVSQYMIHLGTHVHAHEHDGVIEFHKEKGSSLEGHLLFHLSFNYKLFNAW